MTGNPLGITIDSNRALRFIESHIRSYFNNNIVKDFF